MSNSPIEEIKEKALQVISEKKEIQAWDLFLLLTGKIRNLHIEDVMTALQELSLQNKIAIGLNGFRLA